MKLSKEILNLVPYKPGKPISETQREYGVDRVVKLASNENPLGISPMAREAIVKRVDQMHLYPDPAAYELRSTIENLWGIPKDNIVVGNGSNELIDLLIRVYCEPQESILIAEHSFIAYEVCAQAARVKVHKIPSKQDYKIDLSAIADFLEKKHETEKIRLVFIPNPNNPTGTYANAAQVQEFLNRCATFKDVLVVFDEAYTEFVRAKDYTSAQEFLPQYDNLVVLQTLSKAYGLAGLRIGLMFAKPEHCDFINRVRNPFNVNELAQAAAVAALQDKAFIKQSVEVCHQGLDYFYAELKKMALPYIESQANFVMFDTLRDVKKVNESLLKRGIILRPLLNYGLNTQLRMSVGLPSENQIAIAALKEVIAENKQT